MATKLTENELKKIIKNITEDVIKKVGFSCIGYHNPISLGLIKEGLTRTFPTNKTIEWLKKYIGYDELSSLVNVVEDAQGDDVIQIYVLKEWKNQKLLKDKIMRAMTLCGWNLSLIEDLNDIILYQFEQKFKEKKVDITHYKFLYHTSPISHLNKIMKQGLVPRSTNGHFMFPSRIYCFYEDTKMEEIAATAHDLEYANREHSDRINKTYVIYQINVSNLNNDMKFYKDSAHPFGIFTYGNIPPKAIQPISTIDIQD